MPFKHHATNLRVSDDGHTLFADLLDKKGHKHHRTFSLDEFLSNDDGHFRYAFQIGRFADTARNVHLRGAVLVAELKTDDGRWRRAEIDLDKCIGIREGDLTFDPPWQDKNDDAWTGVWRCPS